MYYCLLTWGNHGTMQVQGSTYSWCAPLYTCGVFRMSDKNWNTAARDLVRETRLSVMRRSESTSNWVLIASMTTSAAKMPRNKNDDVNDDICGKANHKTTIKCDQNIFKVKLSLDLHLEDFPTVANTIMKFETFVVPNGTSHQATRHQENWDVQPQSLHIGPWMNTSRFSKSPLLWLTTGTAPCIIAHILSRLQHVVVEIRFQKNFA